MDGQIIFHAVLTSHSRLACDQPRSLFAPGTRFDNFRAFLYYDCIIIAAYRRACNRVLRKRFECPETPSEPLSLCIGAAARVSVSEPVLFLRCRQGRSEFDLIIVRKSGLEDFASELLELWLPRFDRTRIRHGF
jgi:hypothetical protein